MAWEARWGLKLQHIGYKGEVSLLGLNGLGSPLGIETLPSMHSIADFMVAKWPGKPVGD